MIRVVLFDFDDTLVQTRKCKVGVIKEFGSNVLGLTITDEEIDKYWGLPYQEFLYKIFQIEPRQFSAYLEHYREISKKYPQQAYPDTHFVLNSLHQAGFILGIITATSRYALTAQLEELLIPLSLFTYTQTADESPFHKPDPRVFDAVLEELKPLRIDRSQVLYIGDSIRDFMAARDAHISFLGISDNTTSAEFFSKHGAESVESLSSLLSIIKNYEMKPHL